MVTNNENGKTTTHQASYFNRLQGDASGNFIVMKIS